MAKAKEITGLDCSAAALEWAATVLRIRFEEVIELRDHALDFTDIEGVHDMRVAARRLRSAIKDFLPLMEKRFLKSARRDLKMIADSLGVVRDQDVAILALETLSNEAETEQLKTGLEPLIAERRAVRNAARLDLTKAISTDNLTALQENFVRDVDRAIADKKSKKSKGKKNVPREISFNEAGRAAVGESFQEFDDLGVCLYEPFKIEELHEMRIAAKRLRYALELFAACWGDEILPLAGEISKMQSFLGEVHDCDVWIENLSERLRNLNGDEPSQAEYSAAVWLLSKYVKARTANYRAALKLWGEWRESDFAKKMQEQIKA